MSQGTGFRPKQTEALLSIYQGLLGPGSFRDKAALVTEELARLARAEWVELRLSDPEGNGLRLYAVAGSEAPNSSIPDVIPHGEGIVSRVFQSGQAITGNDYAAHSDAIPEFVARGEKSALCLPINAEDRILGTVFIGTKKPGYFTGARLRLMTAIVDALGPPLEDALLREERERAEGSACLRTEELARRRYLGRKQAGRGRHVPYRAAGNRMRGGGFAAGGSGTGGWECQWRAGGG